MRRLATALIVLWQLLVAAVSFAGDVPNAATPNSGQAQQAKNSAYKASPRLNYSSNKPEAENKGLGNLKPMLDQALGNKDSAGGVVMPNGGTYKF